MPWFWTDDLADLLARHDDVDPERLREWRRQPVGVAGDDTTDPLALARRLAGIPTDTEAVA